MKFVTIYLQQGSLHFVESQYLRFSFLAFLHLLQNGSVQGSIFLKSTYTPLNLTFKGVLLFSPSLILHTDLLAWFP